MKRSKHSLSHYKLATFDQGELVPVGVVDVLPGDAIQMSTSALVRVSPLLAPVMHPISVRIHHWFVPYRLLWAGWEEFITGGPDGEGGSSGAFPTIDVPGTTGFAAGSLLDYFGVPPAVDWGGDISALPIRAYNLIFNEFYRDQDLVTALTVPTASGVDSTSPVVVQNCAWEKDYFTSARPWTQKGPDVTLPLGTSAPVVSTGADIQVRGSIGTMTKFKVSASAGSDPVQVTAATTSGLPFNFGAAGATTTGLETDLSTATAVNVNDVRAAFAIQRYQEARAMYGSRYTEYLRYLGVRSSDARLQRPEYLGGGKQTIAFSEILQTGPEAAGGGVGSLKGHGIAAMRSRRFRRFFEEHGCVISLMSVRPRTMYADGLHRMWSKRTKEDFWQKELEHIGQQEVLNKEVYVGDTGPELVFGYQDRYAEYRHLPSTVAGDFRTTLNFWHLARLFASDVTLNAAFVKCEPSKRINAVQSADTLWCMINHSIQARRMVSKAAVGRIL